MALIRRCVQNWPVALILAIPLCGITASMIAVTQAVSQPPEMVRGDYQRLGKAIVDDWQAERHAAELDLNAQVQWRETGIRLQLQPGEAMTLPERLQLRLSHPMDAESDIIASLTRRQGADYASDTPRPAFQGHLTLEPDAQAWRLHGRLDDKVNATLNAGVQRD